MRTPPTPIPPTTPRIRDPRLSPPTPGPVIDTPLNPGIRRVWYTSIEITSLATSRFASPRIAARSVIRTLYFAVDTDLKQASVVTLRLAFNDTTSPIAADFIGTGLLLPDLGRTGSAPRFGAEPQNSASHLELNWQLPSRQSRLIAEITNGTLATVQIVLRMIIDGLSRTGADDARG